MSFSETLKARRKKLHLSQEYVAEQIGVSRQAVAKWESGKSMPNSANLTALAALLEVSVSELTGPQKSELELEKEKQRNAKMHVGRAGAFLTINAGWDGYSSGLYSDLPAFWLSILGIGLILLLVTSMDMYKRRRLQRGQAVLGALLIFSIFFLPSLIPFGQAGFRTFLADCASAAFLSALNLRYWRYIWK